MSQCHPSGSCDPGTGYWWKFEKQLTPEEAQTFALAHMDPNTASDTVDGIPVVLTDQGSTSCIAGASYGCDPGEEN